MIIPLNTNSPNNINATQKYRSPSPNRTPSCRQFVLKPDTQSMDWALAINRNRDALERIIMALFAMAGLAEGGVVDFLPRRIYRAVLIILRPAESAVRRLVIIAARGLVLSPRPVNAVLARFLLLSRKGKAHTPAFPLIDPLKRFSFAAPTPMAGPMPRVSVPGLFDPFFPAQVGSQLEEIVSAAHLCHRLLALKRALDDLPRQAKRLARWQARRDFSLQSQTSPRRLSPFRPGRPPGHRKRVLHEIDDVLRECHGLALDACALADTS